MRQRSKSYGFLALVFMALLIPLQAQALQVPDKYSNFIKTAEGQTKPWWQRICEELEVCEMSAADISVALVIGVSKYQYLRPLESTRNDASELADFLLDFGEFEQVILLTEEDATKDAIEYFMEDYIPPLLQASQRRSRFLFYFSGHGERRPGTDRGYLRLANNRKNAYRQSIGMDQVHAWANFNTKNAIHSLFLIDACMSGIVGQQVMGKPRFDIQRHPADLIKQSAGILITAGTEDQKAHANPYWEGSLFNAVLLQGLRGAADRPPSDGVITSLELFDHLESAVSNESNQTQTPRRWVLRKFQSGDFFFLSPTGGIPPKPEQQLPAGTETMESMAIDTIKRAFIATKIARVREGPSVQTQGIGLLKKGQRVWVSGKVRGAKWYLVEYGDKPAYVHMTHLQEKDEQPPDIFDTPTTIKPKQRDEWRDPVTGMEFVWLPRGCFRMGTNVWSTNDAAETPVHEVCIDGFWMGKYEVTQGQWEAVRGGNPSRHWFKKGNNHPVENVSWNDAQAFIRKLNANGQGRFRLPTEAEWEYACRSGGKREKYCGGNDVDRVAWYSVNSGRNKTHRPVGKKSANGLGLYDMSGNVWEWVGDWYDEDYYTKSPKNNPKGPSTGSNRVIRGGSWVNGAGYCRSASRRRRDPGYRDSESDQNN